MVELLALPFFQRALLTGMILGSLMAVLGVIVVLRKMSFFSDAIGHSALAGIAGGIMLNINPFMSGLFFSLLVALGIANVRRFVSLSIDTLLGVFFSTSVALGVVLVSLTPGYQADLIAFLFGNILTVTRADVVMSLVISFIAIVIMIWAGKGFIAISLDQSLARAEGIPVVRYETVLLLLMAAVIAMSIKFVGVLLVTALLIIPAATAQNLAKSLSQMFGLSIIFSLLSVVIGMITSAYVNLPSGPTIVLTGSVFFFISLVMKMVRR